MPPKPTAVQEAPPAEADPTSQVEVEPAPSLETAPDLVPEVEPSDEGAKADEAPETAPESEADKPDDPAEETKRLIDDLSPETVAAILEQHGEKSEAVQEMLRRKEQSVTDSMGERQRKEGAQKEDQDRVLLAGKQAITSIGNIIAVAEKAGEDGETVKLDTRAIYQEIDRYRDAWVMGQSLAHSRELQDALFSIEAVASSMTVEDAAKIREGMEQSGKEKSRGPMLKAMFEVVLGIGLKHGYSFSHEDIGKMKKRQDAAGDQKEALEKLGSKTPTNAAKGTSIPSLSDAAIIKRHGLGEDVDPKALALAHARLE